MSLTIRYLVGPRGPWRKCFYCDCELIAYDRGRLICDDCEAMRRPLLRRALDAVKRAIRAGKLSRPSEHPCADCGEPAQEYDHRNYGHPLNVEPVCRRCNQLRGPAALRETSTGGREA